MNADILTTLLSDPTRADSLPQEEVPELLGQVERLRAVLWTKLTRPESKGNSSSAKIERASGDKLLTVKEAAKLLGVNDRWMYRKADSQPFTRRLGERKRCGTLCRSARCQRGQSLKRLESRIPCFG